MKKYNLILQGGINLVLTEEERVKMLARPITSSASIEVRGNKFRGSMIKGIFEIREDQLSNANMSKQDQEWHQVCLDLSKLSIEQKVQRELNIRILPGLKMAGITLDEGQADVMRYNILEFFKSNPKYPKCPMNVWWPFIADRVAPVNEKNKRRSNPSLSFGKWWQYIARNDEAIARWVKYNNFPY